jgi:hypothetical protein
VLDFTSGYVRRALATLPAQGARAPWRLHQNSCATSSRCASARSDDPALEFRAAGDRPRGDVAGVGAGGVATRG